MTYAKRYKKKLLKKYLRKVIVLKAYFKCLFPGKTEEEIFHMVCRIGRYHYKKCPKLTEEEIQLYQHMLKMGINPRRLDVYDNCFCHQRLSTFAFTVVRKLTRCTFLA